jgi:molecular chaperone HtpG
MPRFTAHPRLLQTLVGSNIYPSADVCVRELLQNAWDAIVWRRERADGAGGRITVRFSQGERWFEVEDDGIGMNRFDMEASFLQVGRDKIEALGADARPNDQIAFFGIGVLSVFLVAESIEIATELTLPGATCSRTRSS